MFHLNYLFQLFEWHACKLACVAKCMSTINKHLILIFDFDVINTEYSIAKFREMTIHSPEIRM